jgi:hypothetical protein
VYLPTQLALMNEYAPESRYYSVNSVSVEEGSQQGGNPPPPPRPPTLSPMWWSLFTWQQCLCFSYVVLSSMVGVGGGGGERPMGVGSIYSSQ